MLRFRGSDLRRFLDAITRYLKADRRCPTIPEQIARYANGQLGRKSLFGCDFPLIEPGKWIAQFRNANFKPELHDRILKSNAARLLGLA